MRVCPRLSHVFTMVLAAIGHDLRLAYPLVLGELIDFSLFKAVHEVMKPDMHEPLDELIARSPASTGR